MSATNLGTIVPGGTISGEVNFIDAAGLPCVISSASFELYAVGSGSGIASVTFSRVGSTNRYSFSVTDATGAGSYAIIGAYTDDSSRVYAGVVVALFTVGYVPANAVQIGNQTQTTGVDVAGGMQAIFDGFVPLGFTVSGVAAINGVYNLTGFGVFSGSSYPIYSCSASGYYILYAGTGYWGIFDNPSASTSDPWWKLQTRTGNAVGTYSPQNGASGNPVVATIAARASQLPQESTGTALTGSTTTALYTDSVLTIGQQVTFTSGVQVGNTATVTAGTASPYTISGLSGSNPANGDTFSVENTATAQGQGLQATLANQTSQGIGTLATPTNITAGTITTVTNLTNPASITGDLTSTMKTSVTASVWSVTKASLLALASTTFGYALATFINGVSSVGKWLGLIAGTGTDAGTLAEINATPAGVTFNNVTMSEQALSISAVPPTPEEIDTQLSSTHGAGAWGTAPPNSVSCQVTVKDVGGAIVCGAEVTTSSDQAGLVGLAGPFFSNSQGVATCFLPLGQQWLRCFKAGIEVPPPSVITVAAA